MLSHFESVDSGILDTTIDSFDRHHAVNVRASWLLVAEFARRLPPSGGSVIALTSASSLLVETWKAHRTCSFLPG